LTQLAALTADTSAPYQQDFLQMNLHRQLRLLRVCVAVLVVSAGSGSAKSSKVVMSWRNPQAPTTKFHHVLALGLSQKTSVRADFEDALAAQLETVGLTSTPGNTILLRPEGTELDLNYLRGQIRNNNIEAVVVSRLLKIENKVTYVPGSPMFTPYPYYGTFYGYYRTVYPVIYSPDYLQEEKKVRIETNLYYISEPDGILVWTGVTDTFDPKKLHKAIRELVTLIVRQMQSDGVLPGSEGSAQQ
jgi:hypothetical protein